MNKSTWVLLALFLISNSIMADGILLQFIGQNGTSNIQQLELKQLDMKYGLYVYNLSLSLNILLPLLMGLSYLIFVIAKIVIYTNIQKTQINDRPINFLILLEETSYWVFGTACYCIISYYMIIHQPLGDEETCKYINLAIFSILTMFQKAISCGISVFRVAYIVFPDVVILRHREKLVLILIILMALLITALSSYLSMASVRFKTNILMSWCTGHSTDFLKVTAISGDEPITNAKAGLIVRMILYIVEFSMYVMLFHFLHRHDMTMSEFLTESQKRKRRRRNVLQASGHFIRLICEIVTALTLALLTSRDEVGQTWTIFIRMLLAGPISVAYLFSSPILKEDFLNMMASFTPWYNRKE